MNHSINKYKFFSYKDANGKDTIAAVSTYAGRTVKGYAKCDPRDPMNEGRGQALAACRCNVKVAKKRLKRASQKYDEAIKQVQDANAFLDRMERYYKDAFDEKNEAIAQLADLLSQM